jgi:hypothetical protein
VFMGIKQRLQGFLQFCLGVDFIKYVILEKDQAIVVTVNHCNLEILCADLGEQYVPVKLIFIELLILDLFDQLMTGCDR